MLQVLRVFQLFFLIVFFSLSVALRPLDVLVHAHVLVRIRDVVVALRPVLMVSGILHVRFAVVRSRTRVEVGDGESGGEDGRILKAAENGCGFRKRCRLESCSKVNFDLGT